MSAGADPSSPVATQTDLAEFLAMLHRGGTWRYWWTAPGRRSTWFKVDELQPLPKGNVNIYFGVHPSAEIPKTDGEGSPKKPESVRSRIATIEAVNCLFGEFDAKDFEGGKPAALTHILRLPRKPTAIVDSGGGWHVYWILRIPILISDGATRERLCRLQARWVEFVGSDPGAKDLARVLRVPGTLNYKYDPPRPVEFHRLDWECLYDLDELEQLLPADLPGPARPSARREPGEFEPNTVDYWLDQALSKYPDLRNEGGAWLAAQLRDNFSLSPAEIKAVNYPERAPQPAGKPAYTRLEWERTVDSILTRPARDPARGNGNGHRLASEIPPDAGADLPEQTEMDFHYTDLGNAQRFAVQHVGKVCFVKVWDWLIWTGKLWKLDESGAVRRLAHGTILRFYADANRESFKAAKAFEQLQAQALSPGVDLVQATEEALAKARAALKNAEKAVKWGLSSQQSGRIDGMLKEAKVQYELVADPGEFDKDPWLLNVENGVLDLKTGELKPHDPSYKLSKIAGTRYDPAAACPTWLAFLDKIFNGDQAMIAFLQRAAGYSLTGDIREQALFLLYGTGANGKSTFVNALQAMLGDYAMKSRAETLMVKRQDSIPEEVAQLAGVRFMLAAELAEEQTLNESLIKDLTGGDKLRGRKLYHDSFEYWPVAKVWMYGNHNPEIRGTDEGIWRRIKRIPFLVTIPEPEQDKTLPQKQLAELPGILTWAVAGCLEWQRAGLQTPAVVTQSTAEFRAEQDVLAAFLTECVIANSLATTSAGDMYARYQSWSEQGGLRFMSKIAFSRAMEERGHSTKGPDGKPRRDGRGRACYAGLGLLADSTAAEGEDAPNL